jgi:hypothetical protein
MNVELIKMDKDVAKAKLVAYRKAIAARLHSKAATAATKEYEAIENAYRVAAKGLPLIELSKAMAMGGWDEQGRPRFAVGRANGKRVMCDVNESELRFWSPGATAWTRNFGRREFRLSGMPARPTPNVGYRTLTAITPLVPPDVLPRPDTDLSKRVILWEADWKAAPVDPLLLLPIGGDLYAVEAAWDLTPLERAVISGRAS